MATSRWKTSELVRTFNSAPNPIYVLDNQLLIVFLNRACHEWLGPAAEGLLGRRCAYHSTGEPSLASDEPGRLDALAASLCPPPTVLEGRPVGGWVGPLARPPALNPIPPPGAESAAEQAANAAAKPADLGALSPIVSPPTTPSPTTPSPTTPSPTTPSPTTPSPTTPSPTTPSPTTPSPTTPPPTTPPPTTPPPDVSFSDVSLSGGSFSDVSLSGGSPPGGSLSDVSPPGARRRAWFIPIGPEGDPPLAIVAFAAAEGAPSVADTGPLDRGATASTRGAALTPTRAGRTTLPDEEPSAEQLHEAIRRFRHEAAGRYRADRLIGPSVAARRVRRQVELAVAGRASVLLVGPPGSGRRHVASAIHYGGDPRRTGPLVPLDCSVLGPELLVPTIYALTHGRTAGEGSGPGSLLLTDADRIPPEVQTALATEILGRPFPWRLLATAGRSLVELSRRGHYHEELAAALSTLTIELPRLADRREDIPLLAQMFLEDNNARRAKQVAGLTPEALDLLCGYDWPGNLDELADTIAQAHHRAAGAEITPADLSERLRLAAQAALRPRRGEETIVLDEFLGRMERELIRRAIARAKGNKAKAARLLGLSRPRLYRRMVRLGLEPPGEGDG